MVDKRYASDWAKAKSRKIGKEMLESTLLRFRKPREVSGIFLPGIDAVEIYQTIDPLQIPRANVIGFERESEIADELEERGLGFKLERGTVEEWIERQNSVSLDFVSLDYTGPINIGQLQALSQLADKQRKNHFVLHVANLLARDKSSNSLYHYGYSTSEDLNAVAQGVDVGPLGVGIPNHFQRMTRKSNDLLEKMMSKEKVTQEKVESYSSLIRTALSGGTGETVNRMIRYTAGTELKEVQVRLQRESKELFGVNMDVDDPFGSLADKVGRAYASSLLEMTATSFFTLDCRRNGIIDEPHQFVLWLALSNVMKERKFFQTKKGMHYTYISETGAPMIGDILFVSYPERMMNVAANLADELGYPNRFHVRDYNHLRRIYGLIKDYQNAMRAFITDDEIKNVAIAEQNRMFLGRASKPVLTKAKVIEEFQNGATVEEVKEKYRGWGKMPLSQWKAHVTMGTYASQIQFGTPDLEKITREEAMDLISSGIPVLEIYKAYPTSFSLGHLRYLKSRDTMQKMDHL